ncbi:MAG TPA: SufD family Fe-S cluster assembly protein [Patescibacteria group bacterium]|nr:SufD family Fe-S cluster assembly protein [Patescibacteria group bacterium]
MKLIPTIIQSGNTATIFQDTIQSHQIIVEEGAQLNLIAVHHTVPDFENSFTQHIELHDRAVVRIFTGLFNSVHYSCNSLLLGHHAVFEHFILYFAHAKQHLDVQTCAQHTAIDTMSRTIVHGIALDQTHVQYTGSIQIEPSAKRTDSLLSHEGLLLGKQARIDALPGFNIHTNAVKARHNSAVHALRPDQLFYMQTRGVTEQKAKQLIVRGFIEEMIHSIQSHSIRHDVQMILEKKQHLIS